MNPDSVNRHDEREAILDARSQDPMKRTALVREVCAEHV